MTAALRLAALRRVAVRVIVPDQSDNPPVEAACRWYAHELAGEGIRFFRHTEGFPHQKVMLIDRDIGSVGSPNFDDRSFRLQFETGAIVVDEAFGQEVEAMLLHDLERSKPWDPADLAGASFARRLWVSFARLTAPIL